YSINRSKIKDAVRDLTHDLLTVEAEGSHEGAKQMLERYVMIRPEMQKALDGLSAVPVDIEPVFPLAANVPGPRK
ncbi:MAG: dipeptidyl-peptidase 3 family protein, partial [Blastocatellia bacterium]